MTWRTALAAGLMAAGLTGVAALTATAPLAHANGPQLAQLVAAVCDMTTYVERKVKGSDLLPQSDFEDMCVARTTGEALFMGRYKSYDAWWHDLTHRSDFYRGMGASENVIESLKGNYVAITMADGSTILFENSSDNYSTAALAPLQAYSGFTISPNPPSV
jgi:hypothetical protein